MNQTKFDIFAPSQKWQPSKSLFHNHFVDALMLQIYFIFKTLAIVISNGVLLHKLYKKRCKSRADKIFIILSCSDLGVGVFSIPSFLYHYSNGMLVLSIIRMAQSGFLQQVFLTVFHGC